MTTHIADMTPEQLSAWTIFRDQVMNVLSKEELLEYLGGTPKKKRATGTRTPRNAENGPVSVIRKLAEDVETFTSADALTRGVSANSFHGAVKGLLKAGVIEIVVRGKAGFKGKYPNHYRLVGKTGMPVIAEEASEVPEAPEVDAAPAVSDSKVVVTVTTEDEDLAVLS